MTFYTLVNLSSGTVVGDYDTEDAALAAVKDVVRRRGPEAVATIGLGRHDDDAICLIAEGDELAARAAPAFTT